MITDDQILKLINDHVSKQIETVQCQYRDSLDFHDVHIAGLRTVIIEAYMMGQEVATKEKTK